MITSRFAVREHPEHGAVGFKFLGRDWADPVGGMGVAHDILEHFPRDNGSVEHELMALGASLYVREENCYYACKGSRYGFVEGVGSEGHSLCNYMEQEGRACLRARPGDRPLRDHDAEDLLRATAQRMLIDAKEDHNHYGWLRGPSALAWLRHGYRKAIKRYRGISPGECMDLFIQIEDHMDRLLKHAGIDERYHVQVNLQRHRFFVDGPF